jgi:hypothetical protein
MALRSSPSQGFLFEGRIEGKKVAKVAKDAKVAKGPKDAEVPKDPKVPKGAKDAEGPKGD